MELSRGLRPTVENAWKSSPVVVLDGPRGVGKTTLAQALSGGLRYYDLSRGQEREEASRSVEAWLEAMPYASVIDEAQLLPALALEVKRKVDRVGIQPGQLLLTGSTRMRTDELGGTDPLVGRARRLRLLPFAQCEIQGEPRDVIKELFDGDPRNWNPRAILQPEMFNRIVRGGFPFSWNIAKERDRQAALDGYVSGLFSGEIYETTRDRDGIVRMFRWIAGRSGALRDFQKFSRAVEVAPDTVREYLSELADVFLLVRVPGWASQVSKRETTKERVYTVDPSFAGAALGLDHRRPASADHGSAFETFVATELQRLATWSSVDTKLFHWRRSEREEVDLLLEDRATGRLVGFEVKAARESSAASFRGLEALKATYPGRFHRGYVLHCGDHPLPHADDMWSIPFSALWSVGDPVTPDVPPPRSLEAALAAAEALIIGSGGFVEPLELDRWIDAVYTAMNEVVVPRLESVATTIRRLGYRAEVLLPNRERNQTATVTRSDTEVFTTSARLDLRDDRQRPSTKGWSLECRATLRANGQVEWLVLNSIGSEQQDFGGSFIVPINSVIAPQLDDRLTRFAELLPTLITMFSNRST